MFPRMHPMTTVKKAEPAARGAGKPSRPPAQGSAHGGASDIMTMAASGPASEGPAHEAARGATGSGFYQDDYGGFSPLFPGVTIRIASQAAWDEFVSFLTSDTLPGDRKEPPGPIFMRSVMEHEIRHYHDFLLGSYNGMLFRSRLEAVQNATEALHRIADLPGGILPLPLTHWITLSEAEREAQLDEWAQFSSSMADGTKPVSVGVPIMPKEALLEPLEAEAGLYVMQEMEDEDAGRVFSVAAVAAARSYARLQELMHGDASRHRDLITPGQIQEVLALTVQLCAVLQAQGEQQARIFVDFALNDPGLPAGRLWRVLAGMSARWIGGIPRRDGEFGVVLAASFQIMAIGTWTLLGAYASEGDAASPAERLKMLMMHFSEDRDGRDGRDGRNLALDVAATWDYWDGALGVRPWRASLHESLKWAKRGGSFYGKAHELSAPGWREGISAVIHAMMKAYADDQRRLIEYALGHPDDLVDVAGYLNLPAGRLPMPLLRVQMDGAALDLATVNRKLIEPVMTVGLEGGAEGLITGLLKMATPAWRERAADAIAFEHIAQLCDFVFSPHEPQGPQGRSPLLREMLTEEIGRITGKAVRFIL